MAILKSKSYESITAGLNKMVTDLQAYAKVKTDESMKANAEARRQTTLSEDALSESTRALATAEKVAALLG